MLVPRVRPCGAGCAGKKGRIKAIDKEKRMSLPDRRALHYLHQVTGLYVF
jgi:hypothetical protein